MSRPSIAIVWFRRDLRVHDHPGLHHALERYDHVLPLFVVDDGILRGRWQSANRRWFLVGALASLDAELRKRDSALTVVRGDPRTLVPDLAGEIGAGAIVASRDYTPYGRSRDAAVERRAAAAGISWEAGRGVLAHEPEEVQRAGGGAYAVFAPFHRQWQSLPLRAVLPAPARIATVTPVPSAVAAAGAAELIGDTAPSADPALLLEPTESAARGRLDAWAGSASLREYATGRDRLDVGGTSRLSQDLRWGLLSPVEVLERCSGRGRGPERFRSEIAWRDFYAHLLWHEPRVGRESFRRELDDVAWSTDAVAIQAWKDGRTGYPVVDAAMRQLRASGWMHNRARMIVASFLTKHLGVDWRVGEAHFMEHLVDGDPASNNGGWQWAASTGTDPQPYFRIFNPTLQGKRHDPDGTYVRRWVPELASVPGLEGEAVHAPPSGSYVGPIVDHPEARARALAAFEARRVRPGRTPASP
ncbi:MAG TPA: deoxyribodipyrimidine photo-lyase [Candidatus Limnocylindrales bacterium]|nr:deoxyribodipyrimidine photo-lyase [Candidatus Limnocylindrales bacterium]